MKISLFFANYGYNPVIEEPCSRESLVINTTENAKKLKELYKQLKKDAKFINLTIGYYYDKRHEDVLPWKKGDKVYLQRKNVPMK